MARIHLMRPMLAAKPSDPADLEDLKYPMLASPKLDGVRALVIGGVLYSRSLKRIPNKLLQDKFASIAYSGFDGELTVGPAYDKDVFRTTVSAVMSHDGDVRGVKFFVFDCFSRPVDPYTTRLGEVKRRAKARLDVRVLEHKKVRSYNEMVDLEAQYLEKGYEGLMLRHPDAPYKYGRSTMSEAGLVKVKMFEDGEAEVLGVDELFRNENPALDSELGLTKRSSRAEGKFASGTLGALRVRDLVTGAVFGIGSGFLAVERAALWKTRKKLVGKIVRYRFFPTGSKEKPRFPTFAGWRDKRDM